MGYDLERFNQTYVRQIYRADQSQVNSNKTHPPIATGSIRYSYRSKVTLFLALSCVF